MRVDRLFLSLLTGGIACFAVADSTHAPATQPDASKRTGRAAHETVNPHWRSNECVRCHEMRSGEAVPIEMDKVDSMCLKCHDGRSAHAERHPIGRPVPAAGIDLPAGWPAPRGRLGCLTCHDLGVTAGHAHSGDRTPQSMYFLREAEESAGLSFCARCHTANTRQTRHNPHRMVASDGQIQTQACLFCHTKTFSTGPEQRTTDAALKANEITLCIGCHTQHIDFFEPGHIGTHVTPAVRERLKEAAVRDKQQSLMRLPLGRDDVIVCSTCHNPHEAGVFTPGSILDLGAIPERHLAAAPASAPAASHRTTPVATRLGVHLCSECHGK